MSAILCGGPLLLAAASGHAACEFESVRTGAVADIIDNTTFRLQDGQEVRLAGIVAPPDPSAQSSALADLLRDRAVVLRAPAAKPDRYGRLVALAYLSGQAEPVQKRLLEQGLAMASGELGPGDAGLACMREFLAQEGTARQARRGYWADRAAIKNTERTDDILPRIGQFIVAEGKIASVREAGATIYVNFGRRWTRDFAVTISRRMVRGFEAAGLAPKALENRVVRVRGWVELRTGPRIEAWGPGQIELLR